MQGQRYEKVRTIQNKKTFLFLLSNESIFDEVKVNKNLIQSQTFLFFKTNTDNRKENFEISQKHLTHRKRPEYRCLNPVVLGC